jgi:hypothetical protein
MSMRFTGKALLQNTLFAPSPMPSGRRVRTMKEDTVSQSMPADFMQELDNAPAGQPPMVRGDREDMLRQLARTQKLDGSWSGDVEMTAAALLAFVRAGHTTRSGSFRKLAMRAFQWLVHAPVQGFAAFVRVLALRELARATGQADHQAAAEEARQGLPASASELEAAVLKAMGPDGIPVNSPQAIRTLDDLRLAAVFRRSLPVPEKLLKGGMADLALAWAAAVPKA